MTCRAYVTVFVALGIDIEDRGPRFQCSVQGCTSRVVRFEIEIDFKGEGGVQVCIQRLTLDCETDEFEERRNHQACASAYVLVRRLSRAGAASRWGKCGILNVGLRTARSGSWLLDG